MIYWYLLIGLSFSHISPIYAQLQKVVRNTNDSTKINHWHEKINYLNESARYHQATLNDSALWFAQKALRLAKQHQDLLGMVHAKQTQTYVTFHRDELDMSRRHAEELLLHARRLDSSLLISVAETHLANIATRQELYEEALERYLRVLDIETSRRDPQRIAISLLNIGQVFWLFQEYQEALDYFRQGYVLSKKETDTLIHANASHRLATAFSKTGEVDSAAFYAYQSMDLLEGKQSILRGEVTCHLGKILYKTGSYWESEHLLREALRLGKQYRMPRTTARAYLYLGELILMRNQPLNARHQIRKSLEISQRHHILNLEREGIHLLVKSFEKAGKMDSAYIYLQKDLQNQYNIQLKINELKIKRLSMNHEVTFKDMQFAEQQKLIEKNRVIRTRVMVSLILALGLLVGLILIGLRLRQIRTEMKRVGGRLKTQRTELIELNENKDRTFSIIAHDIRTPLNNVLGLIEIILEGHIDHRESKELGAKIQKQINGAIHIFDNLLKWSPTNIHRVQTDRKEMELQALVKNVTLQYQSIAQEKGINLIPELQGSAKVKIEPGMIEAVVRNLLTNAIKFTSPGGTIRVRSYTSENEVVVHVIDTGRGISQEKQQTLFQLDKNQSTRGTGDEKGTGLGLPLVQAFIEQHGGEIAVSSELGKGSTFSFMLPL
ncbi:MAG: ATP-binding protein [Bacteroidota bacterium]